MPSPIPSIAEFKERFDPLLARELDRHIGRAEVFTKDADCYSLLTYVKKLALAGGKRVRPYVVYLMYRTAGGEDEEILESLVAFEIFHTFALIHDDIIDRGSLRHGLPTMHEFALSLTSSTSADSDLGKGDHLAEGLALLAGDLAFNWSKETFARTVQSIEANDLFNDMVYAVVLGQMLDVKMMGQSNPTMESIIEKTLLKTSEYTFVYPMLIGATLAGKGAEYNEWCRMIGTSLGIAFQMQDDLLDIMGTQDITGKKSLQDVAEGQHTIFTSYLLTHAEEADVKEFRTLFGQAVTEKTASTLLNIFERSGAIEYGKKLISEEIAKSKSALAERVTENEPRAAWDALIGAIERRAS